MGPSDLLFLEKFTAVLSPRPGLTVNCKKNRDCNWQALCWKGRCKEAKPTREGDCVSDDDCSGNDGCRFGICFTLIDHGPNEPSDDKPNEPESNKKECRTNTDCPKYNFCVESRCLQGEPTNDDCEGDKKCPNNGICWDQLCWVTPAPSTGGSAQGSSCNTHDDCSGDMLCHDVEKVCKEGVLAVDCVVTQDCGPNAVCKNNKCLKFAPECSEQEDCKGKKLCEKGKCVAGERTNKKCSQRSPCATDEKCKFSYCWKIQTQNGPATPAPAPTNGGTPAGSDQNGQAIPAPAPTDGGTPGGSAPAAGGDAAPAAGGAGSPPESNAANS